MRILAAIVVMLLVPLLSFMFAVAILSSVSNLVQ